MRVIRKIRFLSLYEPDVDWFLADRNFFTEIVHEWEVRMEAKICKISNHSATSFECRKTSILKQEIRREIVDSLIGHFLMFDANPTYNKAMEALVFVICANNFKGSD